METVVSVLIGLATSLGAGWYLYRNQQKPMRIIIAIGTTFAAFALATLGGSALWKRLEIVRVPDLRGLSLQRADQQASDSGLKVAVLRREVSQLPNDAVMAQAPDPGIEVAPGSIVRVVLSDNSISFPTPAVTARPPATGKAKAWVPDLVAASPSRTLSRPRPSEKSCLGADEGSVPHGRTAYSPDGRFAASETEPFEQGRILIRDFVENKEVAVQVMRDRDRRTPEVDNPLKALCWSPDGKRLAVMYHHKASTGYIALVDTISGGEVARVPIHSWYQEISFSPDGTAILAAGDVLSIETRQEPGERPRGTIATPKPGSTVDAAFPATGSVQLESGQVAWLATRIGALYIPKEPSIIESGKWDRMVFEGGPPGITFSLVLITVDSTTNEQIENWFAHARQTGSYPGMTLAGRSQLLAEVALHLAR